MERNPSVLKDCVSLVRWIAYLKTIRPEAVIAATPKASLLAVTAAWLTRRPVRMYQVWGLRLETEKGPRRRVLRALERLTVRLATHVVCNSPSLAESMKTNGLMGKKVPIVLGKGSSHGIDLDRFKRGITTSEVPAKTQQFLEKRPAAMVFGFIGRINQDKGVGTLLAAMEVLEREKLPGVCILVGPIEDPLLGEQLASLALPSNIHYAGATADPRPFLECFDVLCLPSRREGFPNAVLEAAAMGVPAIVTDSTGTVDSVVDGKTGRVVRTDDTEDLAGAMVEAIQNPGRWSRFGAQARSWVEKHFSRVEIWNLQERLISDAIASSSDCNVQ